MKKETRIKIANNALKMGVINEAEYDIFMSHCEHIDHLSMITDEMADDFYGRMVNKQATINLKDDLADNFKLD